MNNFQRQELKSQKSARKSLLHQFWLLYYDGFRHMTIGRTLWTIILVKLFIIFFILRLFFFPNYLNQHAPKGKEANFVAESILSPP